jgi:LEA14-like dessication related protein
MTVKTIGCLVVVFALGFAGCAANLASPVARVSDVRVVQQTDQGSRVEVDVELTNPNKTPLPLVKSSYTVSIAGGTPYHAEERLYRTLPGGGKQVVTLPAVFTAAPGGAYHVTGSVAYEPPGEMRKLMTESYYPLPSVGFSASGSVEK